VDLAVEQAGAQLTDEHACPADLRERGPAHVSEAGQADQLHLAPGTRGQQLGHVRRLRPRPPAAPGAEPQRRPAAGQSGAHFDASRSDHASTSSAGAETASTASGSSSNSTRNAISYESAPGAPASSFTRTVGPCSSLSAIRPIVCAI